MNRLSYLLVITSAILWGLVGMFAKNLYSFNLEPMQIVSLRALWTAVILIIFVLIKDRRLFKIELRDIGYFIGTGLFSFVFFNWCYFIAIDKASLSIAAILLYTAPAFVMVFSTLLFKESMTKPKVFSLVLTIAGCVLVTGYLQSKGQRVSFLGLLSGLGAGLGYALYSIFGKYALRKYEPFTLTLYTFIFASLASFPFMGLTTFSVFLVNKGIMVNSLSLGLFSTVLPFIFYTIGLSKLESSKASIIATLEPVVSMVISAALYGEVITISKLLGILLIISAIFIVSRDSFKKGTVEQEAVEVQI